MTSKAVIQRPHKVSSNRFQWCMLSHAIHFESGFFFRRREILHSSFSLFFRALLPNLSFIFQKPHCRKDAVWTPQGLSNNFVTLRHRLGVSSNGRREEVAPISCRGISRILV